MLAPKSRTQPSNMEPADTTVPKSVGPDQGGGFTPPTYLQNNSAGQQPNPVTQGGDRASAGQGGEKTTAAPAPLPPADGNTPFPMIPQSMPVAPTAPTLSPSFTPYIPMTDAPAPISTIEPAPQAPTPQAPAPSAPTLSPSFTPYIPQSDAPQPTPNVEPSTPAPVPDTQGPTLPITSSPTPPGFGQRQPGEIISAPATHPDSTPWVPSPTPVPTGEPAVPQPGGGITLGDLPTGPGAGPGTGVPTTPTGVGSSADPGKQYDWAGLGDIIMKLLQNPSVYDDPTFKNAIDVEKGDLQDQLDQDKAGTTADFAERGLYGGSNLPVNLDALTTKRDRAMGNFTSNLALDRAHTMAANRSQAFNNVFSFLNAGMQQQGIDLDWAKLASAIGESGAPDQNSVNGLPSSAGGGIDPSVWAAIIQFLGGNKTTTGNTGGGTVTGSNPFPND